MSLPPTLEELKLIFLSGDKKARASYMLMAHSGLRLATSGNYMAQTDRFARWINLL